AELIEIDITGLLDRLPKVHVTVTLLFPAAKIAVPEEAPAGTWRRHVIVEADDVGLHPHNRRRELERRSGRIEPLNDLVVERPARVVAKLRVVLRRHTANEPVRIETRRTVNREHLAGLRIH